MASDLRIELSTASVAVRPGEVATVECTVYNRSPIVDGYDLRLSGLDPSWVELPPATERLFPGQSGTVRLTLHPPRTPAPAVGEYPFTVTAISADDATRTAAATGSLSISPVAAFTLAPVSPDRSSGEAAGSFALRVTNSGNVELAIALEARAEPTNLDLEFDPPRLQVPAGSDARGRLIVRPRDLASPGGGRLYQIDVTAQAVELPPAADLPAERRTQTVSVVFEQVAIARPSAALHPQQAELIGQEARTEVALTNPNDAPIHAVFEARDPAGTLAFEWVGGSLRTVGGGETARVSLRIRCLRLPKRAAQPQMLPFTVAVALVDPAGEAVPVTGTVVVPALPAFRLSLDPSELTATGKDQVRIDIEHDSTQRETFEITALSESPDLAALVVPEVEVPTGQALTVPVTLVLLGDEPTVDPGVAPATHRFTVRVAPVGQADLAKEVRGRYVLAPAAPIPLRPMDRDPPEAANRRGSAFSAARRTAAGLIVAIVATVVGGVIVWYVTDGRSSGPATGPASVVLSVDPFVGRWTNENASGGDLVSVRVDRVNDTAAQVHASRFFPFGGVQDLGTQPAEIRDEGLVSGQFALDSVRRWTLTMSLVSSDLMRVEVGECSVGQFGSSCQDLPSFDLNKGVE